MHEYSETVSTTVMGTLFGSSFALEIMNIGSCAHNFCWMKTTALALLALLAIYKTRVWQTQNGVAVGAFAGFLSPFIVHSYLLFI